MKRSRHFGKQLEWWAREIRSYISLNNHKVYRKLRGQKHLVKTSQDTQLVIFDFHSIAIDNVGGRYLYHLVHVRRESELQPYGHIEIYISDSPEALAASNAKHKILVNYDLRRATSEEVPLTFGPSPGLLHSGNFSDFKPNFSHPRLNTIFFAGRTRAKEYGRDLLRVEHDIMNRLEVLNTVENNNFPETTIPEKQLPEEEWAKPHKLLLIRNDTSRVPIAKWMNLLRNSDFFLACPGAEMPMCHNVIESLAAGCVPILEYPQYLHPSLTNEENCLSFSGPDDLLAVIEQALSMPIAEKEKLQRQAYQFYLEHCKAPKLTELLLAKPETTLIMNDYRIRR